LAAAAHIGPPAGTLKGDAMSERPYVVGAIVGAILGGMFGYLFYTDAGHRHRAQVARVLDHLTMDFHDARQLWRRVQALADAYERSGENMYSQTELHFGQPGGQS
jgi:hypothetical protein